MTGRFVEERLPGAPSIGPQTNASGFGSTVAEDPKNRRPEPTLDMPLPSTFRYPGGKGVLDEVVFEPCSTDGLNRERRDGDVKPDADSSVTSPSGTDISFQCLPEPETGCPFVCGPTSMSGTLGDKPEELGNSPAVREELNRRTCRGHGGALRSGLFNGKDTPYGAHLPNLPIKGDKTVKCTSWKGARRAPMPFPTHWG